MYTYTQNLPIINSVPSTKRNQLKFYIDPNNIEKSLTKLFRFFDNSYDNDIIIQHNIDPRSTTTLLNDSELITTMQKEGAGNFVTRIEEYLQMILQSSDITEESKITIVFHPAIDDDQDFIRMSIMIITFYPHIEEQPFLHFFRRTKNRIDIKIRYLRRSEYRKIYS